MIRDPMLLDSDAPGAAGGDPRRSGSAMLRGPEGGHADEQTMLDPANQSLADSLRVMLWLLKAGMLVLAVLYVASGVQMVRENQRAIRLLFGKVQDTNIEPGAAWSAPFPMGELVRVDQGYRELVLDKDFWVYIPPDAQETSPDKLAPTESLKPGQGGSGSVLTADGNIGHTQWKVGYRLADVAEYSQNLLPEEEEKIVRAAVKRGIVQACAGVTIEQLLTQSGNQAGSVRSKARQVAQETLDRLKSGIQIEQLDPIATIAPLRVRMDFQQAQSAVSMASQMVDAAKGEAATRLLEVAGVAAPYLIHEIDQYEQAAARRVAAAEAGDAPGVAAAEKEMAERMANLENLMLGREVKVQRASVDVAGKIQQLEAGTVSGLAGGAVANILSSAEAYRAGVVNRASGELRRFQAMEAQFKANSRVMVQREWQSAMNDFLSRETTQQLRLPSGLGRMNIAINPDPEILRSIEKAKKAAERASAEEQRMRQLRQDQYVTPTGLQAVPR